MSYTIYPQIQKIQELIEVIDNNDKPIMLMHEQGVNLDIIPHRVVAINIHNHKKQNIVIKKTINNNDILELPAIGIIRAGESRVEATLRVLLNNIGIKDIPLVHVASKLPIPNGKNKLDNVHLSLFFAKIGRDTIYSGKKDLKDIIFLDKDELKGIAMYFPNVLSDLLHWAVSTDLLFEKKTN